MNVDDGVPGPIDLDSGGEDALVLRSAGEVEVRAMPQGGAAFVAALAGGRSLADAAEAATSVSPGFDLAANLAALIGAGLFVGHSFCRATSHADRTGDGA